MGFRSQLAALGACSLLLLLVNAWQRSAAQPVRSRRLVYRQPRPSVAQRGVVPPAELTAPPAATAAAAGTAAGVAVPASTLPLEEACEVVEHLELWGDVVENGDANRQPTAEACCRACRAYEPSIDVARGAQCNSWVWSPVTKACWLKHQKADGLRRADEEIRRRRLAPLTSGPPWTSGVWHGQKPCTDCVPPREYRGCISKDLCNTSHACGSPAIDGYSHVEVYPSPNLNPNRYPTPTPKPIPYPNPDPNPNPNPNPNPYPVPNPGRLPRGVAHCQALLGATCARNQAHALPRATGGLRRAWCEVGHRAQPSQLAGVRGSLCGAPAREHEQPSRRPLQQAALQHVDLVQ